VREAAKAYRREKALDNLSVLMGKPHALQKVNDFAMKNPLFRKAFNDAERAQIERIAKKMAYVPASGGAGVIGQISTTALGGFTEGAGGALAGYIAPPMIRELLASDFARNYTERLLSGERYLSPKTLSALATFARGLMAEPPEQNAQNQ